MEGQITGTLKPLGDRVLIKPDEATESQSKSGIIIPDAMKEKPLTGTVVAVGPGNRTSKGDLIPIDIAVGAKVYYGKFAGVETKVNEETLMLLHADEIYAVVE